MNDTASVEFWFDPACPWAWMTSRWMAEVQRLRPDTEVTWKPMSLAILNEGREGAHHEAHARTLPLCKIAAGAATELGNETVKAFYDALGERIHHAGRTDDALVSEALEAAGISAQFAARAEAGEFDEQLREFHEDALKRVGDDVGTPIIAVNGVAFFGPVISPAPKGDMALQLFDGVVAAAGYDGFFELKRSRTRGPEFN